MKKPENDPVTYEKPLPLELIGAGIGSQFGAPALRRCASLRQAVRPVCRSWDPRAQLNAVLKYLEAAEFIPAGPDGKAVQSEVAVPIVFKLQ